MLGPRAVAEVGDGRQPARGGYRQPATSFFEVAAADDRRGFGPRSGGKRGARKEFVPVGRQNQRMIRVRPPREQDEADRSALETLYVTERPGREQF